MKLIIALLLTSSILYSQNDSVYKFILPELKITQIENGKDVTYGFDNDINVFLLGDSSLTADPLKYNYKVTIADIKKFGISDGNYGWRAAKTAGLVGGAIGVILGTGLSFVYGNGSNGTGLFIVIPAFVLSGVLAGGIVGGILGSFVPYYENYSHFTSDTHAKKEVLKQIFKKHNLK